MLEPIAQLEDLEGLVVEPGVPRLQKQLVQEMIPQLQYLKVILEGQLLRLLRVDKVEAVVAPVRQEVQEALRYHLELVVLARI